MIPYFAPIYRSQRTCWQPRYYDHIIRNEREFEEVVDYIAGSPSSRWADIESYRWLWLAAAD